MADIGELVRSVEMGTVDLKEIEKNIDKIAFVSRDGKGRRDDIDGLEISIPFKNTRGVKAEAIGLAGEYNPKTKEIEPMEIFIGSAEDVRKWLNTFGGLDTIMYVRYYKFRKIIDALRDEVVELRKENEKLKEKLAKKIEEVKRLYNKIKELNERIEELELELAGKEKPIC